MSVEREICFSNSGLNNRRLVLIRPNIREIKVLRETNNSIWVLLFRPAGRRVPQGIGRSRAWTLPRATC